jgi:queuosine precursor transporter
MTPNEKTSRLFLVLGMFFITNALLAEFAGTKIFSLEETFGFAPLNLSFFDNENLSFNLTTGVLLWPFVFVMTDTINEYYGLRGVRLISFITAGLIAYGFLMVFLMMNLAPAEFWKLKQTTAGTINMDVAYNALFGQGLWIIAGSLVAFLIGQVLDVTVFQYLKTLTGSKWIWLRSTGSTLVSQLVDSFVVLFIGFYIGSGWELKLVLAICAMNYIYKSIVAIAMTPLIYLAHVAIENYLGKDLAEKMEHAAEQQTISFSQSLPAKP